VGGTKVSNEKESLLNRNFPLRDRGEGSLKKAPGKLRLGLSDEVFSGGGGDPSLEDPSML